MGNTLKAVIALFPSLVRLGRGAVATGNRGVPSKTLELYDCENDPECRPVREALTVLDLEVMVYPVPENGERFRKQLAEMSGSDRLPFLHDPNTGERLQGAESVVNYLYAQFAPEGEKSPRNLLPLARVASFLRGSKGRIARPGKAPEQPLELYSFEASPYSRLVRAPLPASQRRQEPGQNGGIPAADNAGKQSQGLSAGNGEPPQVGRKGRPHDGALPRGSEHRDLDVPVRRYPGLPSRHLRRVAALVSDNQVCRTASRSEWP